MKRWAIVIVLVCALGVPAALSQERLVVGELVDDPCDTAHPYFPTSPAGHAGATPPILTETIRFPDATFIAVHFSRFELAPGDHVLVRSPDGRQSWRYEERGKQATGTDATGFWAGHIKGDTAIVELWVSSAGGAYGFRIDTYSRGLDDLEIAERNGLDSTRAICGADDTQEAICYQSSEPAIWDQSSAVARLLITGQFLCTGWLVGCEGHLLTNNHCIGSQSDASDTDFEFLAQAGSCSSSCAGSLACPGTVAATSGTLIRTNAALDYSLVRLPGNLSETYGYMRLRTEGAVTNERIYIPQHPAGWGKRVGVFSGSASDQSGFCEVDSLNAPPCSGGPGDVGYFCDTQGGSSGSPVLGYSDHKVVALHHCASCANRGVNIVDVIASLGSDVPDCATQQLAGSLAIDRQLVRCSDQINIIVQDDSLAGLGNHPVTISSSLEPGPETLMLTEGDPGLFSGTLFTSAGPVSSGDDTIAVTDADTIVVQYIDADDGNGGSNVVLQRSAVTDCRAPTISSVQIDNVTGSSAHVTYTTDEPTNGVISYSPPAVTQVVAGTNTTSFDRTLGGLEGCTGYNFELSNTDAAGNVTIAGNGGQPYAFTTGFDARAPRDSLDTPLAVPDNNQSGVSSTLTVAADFPVLDVEVGVEVEHNHVGELLLVLTGPAGNSIPLSRRRGGSGDDFVNTVFDDDATMSVLDGTAPFTGSFRPEQPLGSLLGNGPLGDWTLRVVDGSTNSIGTLLSWTLFLERADEGCPPLGDAPTSIPDGTTGAAPLRLVRQDPAGDTLQLSWGQDCANDSTKIVYGPLSQVGSWTVSGAECSAASPATLSPAPGGDLWFVVIGQNAASVESSWGQATVGERNGLAASGTCGSTLKNLSGTCP